MQVLPRPASTCPPPGGSHTLPLAVAQSFLLVLLYPAAMIDQDEENARATLPPLFVSAASPMLEGKAQRRARARSGVRCWATRLVVANAHDTRWLVAGGWWLVAGG